MGIKFCSENLEGGGQSEDLGADGGKYENESQGNRVERCGLDSSGAGRDQRRAFVNMVMNVRVPQKMRNFLTS
jgi:hypothetical protein